MSNCGDTHAIDGGNECRNRDVKNLKDKVDGFLVRLQTMSPKRVKVLQTKVPTHSKRVKNVSKKFKSKPKLSTEASEKNVNSDELVKTEKVPTRVLKVKIPPAPKLLTVIHERSKSRTERLEEIKVIKNERKIKLQREMEERMKFEFEAQEQERLAKERKEKELKENEEAEKKRLILLKRHAIKHYNKSLMKFTFLRLRRIAQKSRIEKSAMEDFFSTKIVRFALKLWKENIDMKKVADEKAASDFFQLTLFRGCLHHWQKVCEHYARSRQAADAFFEFRLARSFFSFWQRFTRHQRKDFRMKIEIAQKHHERNLIAKHFRTWTSFPAINKIDQEKEKFKSKLRSKVRDYLNDFDPQICEET